MFEICYKFLKRTRGSAVVEQFLYHQLWPLLLSHCPFGLACMGLSRLIKITSVFFCNSVFISFMCNSKSLSFRHWYLRYLCVEKMMTISITQNINMWSTHLFIDLAVCLMSRSVVLDWATCSFMPHQIDQLNRLFSTAQDSLFKLVWDKLTNQSRCFSLQMPCLALKDNSSNFQDLIFMGFAITPSVFRIVSNLCGYALPGELLSDSHWKPR